MVSVADLGAPARPFLKWAGGKAKLAEQLTRLAPPLRSYDVYIEPFLGGGAFYFHLRNQNGIRCAFLSDRNQALVTTYLAVREHTKALIERLYSLQRWHRENPEASYREARNRFNGLPGDAAPEIVASLFIYLNKTCFNGLYRVNKHGAFNTPIGKFKTQPTICDVDTILAAERALRLANITRADFETTIMRHATRESFVYLDPPYDPVSETSNFIAYAGEFGKTEQIRLRLTLGRLPCRWMLSNSDTPFIRQLYADYHVTEIKASRAINSKAEKRGPVPELVIRNYK